MRRFLLVFDVLSGTAIGPRSGAHGAVCDRARDFCSPKARLVIELDGAQHLEQEGYDAERTACLEPHGYRVLRFWNHDVIGELDLVALAILEAIQTPPRPSPF